MIVLAADTSTAFYSVAAVSVSGVHGEVNIGRDRRHSERLLATADGLLCELGLSRADLGALAVSVGPGSFTGLRVGVSAWKGLALGWGLPLIGVSTLDALARHGSSGAVCPVLDAKMSEVFWGLYEVDESSAVRVRGPEVTSVEAMIAHLPREVLLIGDGADRYRETIESMGCGARFAPAIHSFPRAASVGCVALEQLAAGDPGDAETVEPVYLRGSQAEEARIQAKSSRAVPVAR